jgi:hypothetical protein
MSGSKALHRCWLPSFQPTSAFHIIASAMGCSQTHFLCYNWLLWGEEKGEGVYALCRLHPGWCFNRKLLGIMKGSGAWCTFVKSVLLGFITALGVRCLWAES